MAKKCIFLSNLGRADSPPSASADVVFETLIVPVLNEFPEFEVKHYLYESEPGSIDSAFLAEMMSADLVIADLTELTSSGYYQLGIRHAADLPTILIAQHDYVISFSVRDFGYIRYLFDAAVGSPEERASRAALSEAIATATAGRGTSTRTSQARLSPQQTRDELAIRLQEATEAIKLLRVNSVAEIIVELEQIASDLEVATDEATPSVVLDTAERFLGALGRFFEQPTAVRGSKMILAGSIAFVLGGAGWSGVSAYAMGLAFWEGKEAFLRALELLNKGRKRK